MAKNISCPDCDKTFRTESGLDWHLDHTHGKNDPAAAPPMSGVKGDAVATANPTLDHKKLELMVLEIRDQSRAVREAVLDLDPDTGALRIGCPRCGSEKWEYYEAEEPGAPVIIQGFRCCSCEWRFDLGEQEAKEHSYVDVAG